MTWRPKNFSESLIPLKATYAIIGHGVFNYPVGQRHPIFSLIYAIILTSSYCVALGFTLDFCVNASWFGPSEKIFFGIIYTNVAIAGLAQILSWYHERMCFRLTEKISKVDETLQKLGATFDYTRSFNWGIALIFFWLIIIFSLNWVDVLWLLNEMPFYQIIMVVVVLHHPVHINSIVAFNFSMVVRLIGIRFRKANELLEKIATPLHQRVNDRAWQYLGNKITAPMFAISKRQNLNDDQNRKAAIQTIKHVHLELSSISKDFNKVFGVQITLEITAYFVMFTGLLYDLYTVAMNPSMERQHLRILVIVVWCGTYFAKLMLINQACEAVSAEAHRTGDIIHCIHESVKDPELPDEIKQFALQIIQHPLFFSPAGLFTLGYKFVLEFLGTVTTYLVILMQMSGAPTRG